VEYSVEFIKFITDFGTLRITKLKSGYSMHCADAYVRASNILTTLMLLAIQLKKKQKRRKRCETNEYS
jgi:hypothetical protein